MEKDYEEIIDFLNVFEKRYKEEAKKLPFPVNLIECIGIDEVGHSRILAKLLEYKNSQGKYVILESLIKRLGFEPKAKEPLITQEKERIDIWVRDKDYAIIFENKACDANDQESQICRYIKATLARGYKKEQIYIVYLPSDEKEPEDQSWNELKQEFASRYKNFPFRSEVLPWLRDLQSIIEEKEVKEVYLRSVLNQYITPVRDKKQSKNLVI